MMNRILPLAGFLAIAAPASAFEMEVIGMIEADFDGNVLTQETLLVTEDGETNATAEVRAFGPVTTLNIYSGARDQLSLNLSYMAPPSAQAEPMELTIAYFENGMRQFWTSDEAPSAPTIVFDTLELGEDDGQAEGRFEATLCRVDGIGAEPDTSDCKPISGRFATRLLVVAD